MRNFLDAVWFEIVYTWECEKPAFFAIVTSVIVIAISAWVILR